MKNRQSDQEKNQDDIFPNKKTVYGPVKSWRFGQSLGVDLLFEPSTCSFSCIYCQLGDIKKKTREIKEYVQTDRVIKDFKDVLASDAEIDVIAFSGSGEPTLASNLGKVSKELKALAPEIPHIVLTNATNLSYKEVQENLKSFDKVIIKLDAESDRTLQQINRPADGITLQFIMDGIKEFKKNFNGAIEVQTMFTSISMKNIEDYANLLLEIMPDVVQLNTPKRPFPLTWHRENRGNHLGIFNYEVRQLKVITRDQAVEIEDKIRSLTGLQILSIYRD